MKHLEILVEEASAAEFIAGLIPRLTGPDVSWEIREFSGKNGLLKELPRRLAGYVSMTESIDMRIVVLIDRDSDDCMELKQRLDQMAAAAGLTTKSQGPDFRVVNRIAVEELEAWYFGDVPALRHLYPKISASLGAQAKFRDPDAIAGGTWEALERVLQRSGYERGGLRKVALARAITEHMTVDANRSMSFQVFLEGFRSAVA